jgi:ABC-2 type transport system ATP-binding protein
MGIILSAVGYRYGSREVFSGVSLAIDPGVTAIIGRNGSGKTTLLKLAAGIFQPTSGRLNWNGIPYAQALPEIKTSLGFMPQDLDFPEEQTPRKLLTYLALIRLLDTDEVMHWLANFNVAHLADRPFGELSPGQIALIGLAQACLGTPALLIFDEFSQYLSIEERRPIFEMIKSAATESILLFSTHNLQDVEYLADQVVVIDNHKIRFTGSPSDLAKEAAGKVFFAEASTQLPPQAIRIHQSSSGEQRVLCAVPLAKNFRPAEATLEDGLIWVTRPAD